MHERIFDYPRIILPGPRYLFLGPGCSETAVLHPQIPMYPPYWLGMIAMDELHVVDIRFGNESSFASCGAVAVPSHFFDVKKVDCLIPISAKRLGPSERVLIEVDNWSCASVQTALTIWGSHHPQRLPDSYGHGPLPPPPGEESRPQRLPQLAGGNYELSPIKTYWR